MKGFESPASVTRLGGAYSRGNYPGIEGAQKTVNPTISTCGPLPITIALISTYDLLYLGVQRVVEVAPHLCLVGQAYNMATAGVLLARHRPQVVLIDTESAGDMGESVRVVRDTVVGSKIVALCDLRAPYQRLGGIIPSVDAVVLTVQPTVVLVATIESLCGNMNENSLEEDGLRDGTMNRMMAAIAPPVRSEGKWPGNLTEREREVIMGVAQGLSNKAIAALLRISDNAVRHHLTNIFDKLGVSDRQTLLLHGHRCGFLPRSVPD